MPTILGIIFSNIQHTNETFEVTKVRTIASLPIGGRYRLIDFPLSNMVSAGVSSVGILTKSNYLSLMDHVGSGKDWDLSRKNGGLTIIPPYGQQNKPYTSRLDALKNIIKFIEDSREEYVIMTDCYNLCNVDYKKVIKFHEEHNADITCMYHESVKSIPTNMNNNIFTLDDDGRITEMDIVKNYDGSQKVSIDIWYLKKTLLVSLIRKAIDENYNSFNNDLLKRHLKSLRIYGCGFEGFFASMLTLKAYYDANMALLDRYIRKEMFNKPGMPILTKIRDSAPTYYGENSKVENSLIADGCIIEGEVYNSIIFHGTKIEKGAIVKNCILMQDTFVARNTILDAVIADKNVRICNTEKLIGTKEKPEFIGKNGVL